MCYRIQRATNKIKEEEYQILTGRRLPVECRAELHTDYDGAAVRWGLTHHKESAADCCQACLDQAKHAKPGAPVVVPWVSGVVSAGPTLDRQNSGTSGKTGNRGSQWFPVLDNCNDVSNG
ncbi:hypothetical protein V6N11_004019 [Hibiscus sabdariffa]|uniref:Uncharacterized protein n=1 Tax=Hibiscus sabdariffa TaxID=183260 RepID=A0ABR2SF00_9ROSI